MFFIFFIYLCQKQKKMITKMKIKISIIVVLIAEAFFLYNCARYSTCACLVFIISWLLKDLYCDWAFIETEDFMDNEPFVFHNSVSNNVYQPTQSYYSTPYYQKKEAEAKAQLLKQIKPNMNIVLEDDDSTKVMQEKKQAYISHMLDVNNDTSRPALTKEVIEHTTVINTVEPKQQLLLPQKAESVTSFNSLIYVDNSPILTDFKKSIYNSIISFLSKQVSPCICKVILNDIKLIDAIEETRTAVLYFVNPNILKRYCVDGDKMLDTIKTECNITGDLMIETFLPTSILDFYEEKMR